MKYTLASEINPLFNQLDQALAEAKLAENEGSRANIIAVKALLNEGSEWREPLADCIEQIFLKLPQLGHQVPRDLLWFAGGACLHFLDDSEIERFASVDEVWQTSKLSWQEALEKTQAN